MHTSRTTQSLNLATLLRAIADTGQPDIGIAVGHDRSWVSRFQNDHGRITLDEMLKLLDACGLVLVRQENELVSLPKDEHQALVTFAAKGLEAYRSAGNL